MKKLPFIAIGGLALVSLVVLIVVVLKENRISTSYDFEELDVPVETGNVLVRLTGAWTRSSDSPQESEQKSPYELAIFYTAASPRVKKMKITLSAVICVDGNHLAEPITESYEKETLISTKGDRVYVLRKPGLTLPHERVIVRIRLEIDGQQEPEVIGFELMPVLIEEKSNDLIEGILSI